MKVHLRVFVEIENLGKAMNALTDAGITGFYILEYKGMSPQDWEGFVIKEDPKSTIGLIRDYAKEAVLVCSVVDEEKVDNSCRICSKITGRRKIYHTRGSNKKNNCQLRRQ